MEKDKRVYLAGHTGLIGSAIMRRLKSEGFKNIIYRTHKQLDLTQQAAVNNFFKKERPEYVILMAAKVGGIRANNSYPAQFIYENIAIQTNVLHAAHLFGVKKLLFFGSACSYPRDCPQPIKEKYLLSGYLEPTNKPYAIAKISGIIMLQSYVRQYGSNFICAIPTNTYGPGDDFTPDDSHVIPALIGKFHQAKLKGSNKVAIWGTGKPQREFLYADDLADAGLFLMENYNSLEIVNIGTGIATAVRELAAMIKDIVGYKGRIVFDTSKPDGALKKVLDVSRINKLGWRAKIKLEDGVTKTYKWYIKQLNGSVKRS